MYLLPLVKLTQNNHQVLEELEICLELHQTHLQQQILLLFSEDKQILQSNPHLKQGLSVVLQQHPILYSGVVVYKHRQVYNRINHQQLETYLVLKIQAL